MIDLAGRQQGYTRKTSAKANTAQAHKPDSARSCPATASKGPTVTNGECASRNVLSVRSVRSDTAAELDPTVKAPGSIRSAALRAAHFRNTAGGLSAWQVRHEPLNNNRSEPFRRGGLSADDSAGVPSNAGRAVPVLWAHRSAACRSARTQHLGAGHRSGAGQGQ